MIYTRGQPAEYDAWKDAGNTGWGWEDVLPFFTKSERALYSATKELHGTKGEWCNQTSSTLEFPGFPYVVDACKSIGLPWISDVNDPENTSLGCGALHLTRDNQQHRHSTFHAFLPFELASKRLGNLHILTNTLSEKLEIQERLNGCFAGVMLTRGQVKVVKVKKEMKIFGAQKVVDCTVEHNIAVTKDLPAVGSNLQDHFGVSVAYEVPMKDSLLALEKRPWVFIIELFRYLVFGTGMLLAPVVQLVIFASSVVLERGEAASKSADSNTLPNIEIMPMAYDSTDRPEKNRGMFSFLNVLLHPKSTGTVRLASSNPSDPLIIDPRYLSHPDDFAPLRAALKLSLRIGHEMATKGYNIVPWDAPLPDAPDDTLDNFIRRRNRTTYHYSSTCRMAPEEMGEQGGVVNEELLVQGFDNLRVADSSVFPWVLGTHLQAPTVMVAEKCADMISKLNAKNSD